MVGRGGTAAIVAAALSLGLAYFLSGVCKLQSFFPASTPKAEPQQEGRQLGRGGGGRLDSSFTVLSSTICECIFYAANNLIKILCVCLGPIKVIIEGRPPLLTTPSCPPTQSRPCWLALNNVSECVCVSWWAWLGV